MVIGKVNKGQALNPLVAFWANSARHERRRRIAPCDLLAPWFWHCRECFRSNQLLNRRFQSRLFSAPGKSLSGGQIFLFGLVREGLFPVFISLVSRSSRAVRTYVGPSFQDAQPKLGDIPLPDERRMVRGGRASASRMDVPGNLGFLNRGG